jgi:hypothetical protein
MFIPRHPVVENQFCSYGAQTGTGSAGVGGVVAYAGSVVGLLSSATNQEPVVYKMAYGVSMDPFGFLMQKVKTGYHQVHPTGYFMPGDFGSSDVLAQPDYNTAGAIIGTKAVPVGVAHLGIWDTVHYTSLGGAASAAALLPSQALYPAADSAKVTNSTVGADGSDAAGERVIGTGTATQVAIVVKGASAAKASANINNTTLYPIRIKLLV